jgi:hypothetical protein
MWREFLREMKLSVMTLSVALALSVAMGMEREVCR